MKKRANARRSAGFATCMIFSCWASAFALDARLDVSQYAHTAWRVSDGFLKGVIFAIDQTPDGYLWFGTEFGLLRFDCARRVSTTGTWLSRRCRTFRGRMNLIFRVEAFNLFNRVQFGPPNTQASTAPNNSFGKVTTQVNQPRLLELALGITF
jgi:hypothetical protein